MNSNPELLKPQSDRPEKYDRDIISLLILMIDKIRTSRYSQEELYFLQRHLDEDTEVTLKLFKVESLVSRLSNDLTHEIHLASKVNTRLDSLISIANEINDLISER